jgi:hypothetical protein
MTPNGAVLFTLLVILAAALARDVSALTLLLALVLAFGLVGLGTRMLRALAWSAAIVAPLAAFMSLVWIVVVGRAPHEIAAGVAGSRTAAALYVAVVCLRLFIMATVVQVATQRFADMTPLRFIRSLMAPLTAKKLLILTLSLIETILQAVDRARTALIAAGVITRRWSLTNLRNGWILVQTVWLTTLTIALGRMRDKWPAEGSLSLLDDALQAPPQRLAPADWLWLGLALASAILTVRLA